MNQDIAVQRRLEWVSANALRRFLDRARTLPLATPNGYCLVAGGIAGFFGVGSPNSIVRGAALDEPWTDESGETAERFYAERGDPLRIDVVPGMHPSLAEWLRRRGATATLHLAVYAHDLAGLDESPVEADGNRLTRNRLTIHEVDDATSSLQRDVVASGFNDGRTPDQRLALIIEDMARVQESAPQAARYLARLDGEPVGGGRVTWIDVAESHGGGRVALLQGASTVPQARRRGVQSALLRRRLARARAEGCGSAVVSCEPGSASERNIARAGFRRMYDILRMTVPRG